jgi:hypothetical protein
MALYGPSRLWALSWRPMFAILLSFFAVAWQWDFFYFTA